MCGQCATDAERIRAEAALGAAESGWLDPPNPAHYCHNEMPKNLTRADWQRRWQCSCGRVYKVQDSQRDGYYFEEVRDGT